MASKGLDGVPYGLSGIYQIECLVNGRKYVGSAVDIRKRWGEHMRGLDGGFHHSRHMLRAWMKHGKDNFSFSVIEACQKAELVQIEQHYLDLWRPSFNSAPTAGSQLGYKHTAETRAKLSKAAKRTKNFTGKRHSEESRRKISESRKGKGCGPRSDEARARMSASQIGRVISVTARRKISASLTGRKQPKEVVEKRSAKLRGRVMPIAFGEAVRQRMLGRSFDEAHRESIARSKARLSESQVREIRRLRECGQSRKSLATEFGIDPASITSIVNRTSYRWVA